VLESAFLLKLLAYELKQSVLIWPKTLKAKAGIKSPFFLKRWIDFVTEDNPVRVVDIFVDGFQLEALGFERVNAKQTDRPGYYPGTMLKLYIYGYLNRIQSSPLLEKEAHQNVELMWLLERLTPDFKNIADFRKTTVNGLRMLVVPLLTYAGRCKCSQISLRPSTAVNSTSKLLSRLRHLGITVILQNIFFTQSERKADPDIADFRKNEILLCFIYRHSFFVNPACNRKYYQLVKVSLPLHALVKLFKENKWGRYEVVFLSAASF
jgi:hypothetical protein